MKESESNSLERDPASDYSTTIDWIVFTGRLGEDVQNEEGFWRLHDAIKKAKFLLASGLCEVAVITRVPNERD